MIRAAIHVLLVAALATGAAADPAADQAAKVAADKAAAEKVAAEADRLANDGHFKEAAEKFAEAFKLDPSRPRLFCNVGISYFKANELPRAHLLIGRCLERSVFDPQFVEAARAVLGSVEATLREKGHTPVVINVEPSATSVAIVEFGPEEAFVGPRTIWLPFGTFHLAVHAEGYVEQTIEVVTTTQEPKTVPITLQRKPAEEPHPKPVARTRRLPVSKTPAIAVTIGTVALIGLAIGSASVAQSRADLANAAIDEPTFKSDHSSMNTWNTVMVTSTSLAIAGAVASGYLWYRVNRGRIVPLELNVSGNTGTVSWSGRF